MKQSFKDSKEAIVLYSGGLDSRLAIKILLGQGFNVTALYFNLPFGCGCCNLSCNFNFTQKEGVKIEVFDVTKEPYLSEYLRIIKDPKYGTGSGINPCKDCKIYIFKKAKEIADKRKIKVIATGEVLGQRPMSQIPSAMKIIDGHIGFQILRPLSAKLLPKTNSEKEGLVDRTKLLDINGRSRKKQIALAEKYNINFPSPGGGCFLCEKESAIKLIKLLDKKLITEKTLPLTMIGRHFLKEDTWFIVARNQREGKIIETFKENHIPGGKGKPSVYSSSINGKSFALKLQKAYSTGATKEERQRFSKFKI